VKRTLEQAFQALHDQVAAWGSREMRPDLRIFVYPPEWEALVLARMPAFAESSAGEGLPVMVEDVGQGFLAEIDRRKGFVDRLSTAERDELLHDLGWVAAGYLRKAMKAPLELPAVCRILVNTGSLGTFVSYSSIANELGGEGSGSTLPATVLAFPGEGDDRSLNLLRLRVDTNYRVPRI
jgi:hypothetical protein